MFRKNIRGMAGVIEVLLVVVVLTVAGLVVWRVFNTADEADGDDSNVADIANSEPIVEANFENASVDSEQAEYLSSRMVIPDGLSDTSGDEEAVEDTTPVGDYNLELNLGDSMVGDGIGVFLEEGQTELTEDLYLVTDNFSPSDCTIQYEFTADLTGATTVTGTIDNPAATQEVVLVDGMYRYIATCTPGEETLTAEFTIVVMDRLPRACADDVFSFEEGPASVKNQATLRQGMIGIWQGCLSTSWVPTYNVQLEFKRNGTYRSRALEVLDFVKLPALYYGSDKNSPSKTWSLTGFSTTTSLGSGTIIVYFNPTTVTDELSNIKLMGSNLSFDMYHVSPNKKYGPLHFELKRASGWLTPRI